MHCYSNLLHSVSPLDAAAISTFRHSFFQSVLSKLEMITASVSTISFRFNHCFIFWRTLKAYRQGYLSIMGFLAHKD